MYRKSDSDDAEAIALATLNMLDKLPDACPNDAYWSLGQLVHRRDNMVLCQDLVQVKMRNFFPF